MTQPEWMKPGARARNSTVVGHHTIRKLRSGEVVHHGDITLYPASDLLATRDDGLDWAVEQWKKTCEHRPLVNIQRRTLDTSWRTVIRYFGGDDVDLCGPAHDDLLEQQETPLEETKTSEGGYSPYEFQPAHIPQDPFEDDLA